MLCYGTVFPVNMSVYTWPVALHMCGTFTQEYPQQKSAKVLHGQNRAQSVKIPISSVVILRMPCGLLKFTRNSGSLGAFHP